MSDANKAQKEATKKPRKKSGPKSVIELTNIKRVEKKMPENIGKGAKYAFLGSMQVGECVCLPPGSFNVDPEILKRALQGAARRFEVKIVTSVDADGFNIWRKS